MPLPQRSYSEQASYSKGRSQWQRSKSHANSVHPTPPARPLAPISEKTKNKLNQFQFQPPKASDSTAETHKCLKTGGEENNINADPENQISGDTAAKKQAPEPNLKYEGATTPAGRLSLRDLLASDANQNPGHDDNGHVSPGEHIMWNNKQDHKYLAPLSPMISRNGRKRARSSSPLSSPLNDTRKTLVPAVDLKKLSEALRSPHADPTLELWDRFSLGNNTTDATTPLGASNPTLAQLMVSSSPRSGKSNSRTTRTEGGLRRAISAGLNWPKRRRIDRPDPPGGLRKPTRELSDTSKSSLVTALLDTVESKQDEGLPSMEIEGDRSTGSPSPKKSKKIVTGPAKSFPTAPSQPLSQTSSFSRTVLHPSQAFDQDRVLPETTSNPDGSDYGDDDFLDSDTLLHLENNINTLPNSSTHQPTQTLSEKTAAHDRPVAKAPVDDDEFDADFDDAFDDDLDENIFEAAGRIVADAENKLAGPPSTPRQQGGQQQHHLPQKTPVNDNASDDDFGDDFGENFDFDAVERAATQSIKQHDPSFPAVRPRP
ncbi:hypothetical protein SODALDRAFT_72172 [Sodiomyces alkalinus F11]|uniref:Uncharacterized protein n=1 Tax=Sodiomyces alkalinus (strain CBS 110278 / VKM F-3762 / F11) TaxID=1314773 RepID=A0A3N2PJZ4_SODAK|nr:hypothetical protein SODALDRAFT_72172 [Sodiomyces alkalinus F11]ROT34847.1 hypothetical protein SODALDRAFT_72172 [Sodiomyces alkalinus F11]